MADSTGTGALTRHLPRPVRALWEWGWRNHRRLTDWAYVVLLVPSIWGVQNTASIGLFSRDGGFDGSPFNAAISFGTTGLVALAVLVRRRHPDLLMTLGVALILVFGNALTAMFGLFSYASWSRNRWRLAAWTAGLMVIWGGMTAISFDYNITLGFHLISHVIVLIVLPLAVGLWVGTRRQLVANLRERAERLERERHLLAERATTAERTRIAREMHDVVAHRVSMMVLHAGGLEVSTADHRTAEIAGTIRTTGREALGELRGILGVLRDDGAPDQAPTGPQPVLADLERLLADWRTTGMRVRRSDTGRIRALPSRVERTAYRVVQEGLTNAAKHAPGADARVRLDFGTVLLTVLVTNGPAPARTGPPPPESGYGLIGLAERVSLAGGTLESDATFDGGWRLRADLPVDPDPGPRDGHPHGSEREHSDSHAGRTADPDDAGRR